MVYDFSNRESKKKLIKFINSIDEGKYKVSFEFFTGNEEQMRKLYFKTIVEPLARHVGISGKEAHKILKREVIPSFNILTILEDGSTKEFSKEDWSIYILECEIYLQKQNINVKNEIK